MHMYTAVKRDVLGCKSQTTERYLKGHLESQGTVVAFLSGQ